MQFSQIVFEKQNRVAKITLNRPEKLNAYSEVMVHEILAALADARDDDEIRAHYGAGHAHFQAAEAKQTMGDAATDDIVPPEMTIDNLYHEALRHFRRAQELADRTERDELSKATSVVEKAIARKARRL